MSAVTDREPNVRRGTTAISRRNRPPRRVSVTLSRKSAEAFDELKRITDAYSDSEVIRNALRIHHILLQRQLAGETLLVRKADGSGELTNIDLFVVT